MDADMLGWLRAPRGIVQLRYDDVREAMIRETSIFLAESVVGRASGNVNVRLHSMGGRCSCWRTKVCERPIAAAAWGSCRSWNRLNAASSTAA